MIIPLSPILGREFGGNGMEIGLLISLYSFMQFFTAPFWGELSDKWGRKWTLLLGSTGLMMSHILFAFSTSLEGLFFARFVAGLFAGNLPVATAALADASSKEERSKSMSLVGMAFGLGFTLGPALGILAILAGSRLGPLPPFGVSFASLMAALACVLNILFILRFFKDKLPSSRSFGSLTSFSKSQVFSRASFSQFLEHFKTPILGGVLLISFLLWLALAQIEPTLILLVQDDFGWNKTWAYAGFAYIGILMFFSQAFLVRRCLPWLGERRVAEIGLFTFALGLCLIYLCLSPAFKSISFYLLVLAVTLFSLGYSLSHTALSGAISLLKSSKQQGSLFGVNQSLSSFARIVGPVGGGLLYKSVSHGHPFLISGVLGFASLFLVFKLGKSFPNLAQKKQENSSSDESLYFVDKLQLTKLVDKNIPFYFFKLEKSKAQIPLFSKAQFKTEDEIRKTLTSVEKNSPIVFVCNTGSISRSFSFKIRQEGWSNTYYVKGGVKDFS